MVTCRAATMIGSHLSHPVFVGACWKLLPFAGPSSTADGHGTHVQASGENTPQLPWPRTDHLTNTSRPTVVPSQFSLPVSRTPPVPRPLPSLAEAGNPPREMLPVPGMQVLERCRERRKIPQSLQQISPQLKRITALSWP